MKHSFITPLASVIICAGLAGVSSAATIYSQSFDTDTSDLLTGYGYSQYKSSTNAVGNPRVENGVAVWTGGASGVIGYDYKLYRNISDFTYDWSQPLTYSIQIGSQSTGSGQSYGLFLGTSATQPSNGGVSYSFYWPSASNGSFFGDGGTNNRITNNTSPDVTATARPLTGTPTLATVAFTIRQNEGNSALFDYMVTVNGTAQTTVNGALPSGVTQAGDWYVGLSKSTYGIGGADPFNVIGVRADGLGYDSYLDNLSLTMIPEPSSFMLAGMAGLAAFIRRRPCGNGSD